MTDETFDLDAARARVLEAALTAAPTFGWSDGLLRQAVADAGLADGHDKLAFPKGVSDLIRYYSKELDLTLLRQLDDKDLSDMKVRERVAHAVRMRIQLIAPRRAAAKRLAAYLALPFNGPLAAELVYTTVDAVWHGIGDRSTDFNFYTKRAILAGVYSSTLLHWLGDDSPDYDATWAFLARRIDNVMQFESVKAHARKVFKNVPSPWSILGAVRYSGRR